MISNKYSKIILGILPELLLIFVIVKLGLAPVLTLERLESANTLSPADSILFASVPDSIVDEISYKRALLKLSSADSIQLVLNLTDSQAILSIHGVPISNSRLTSIKIDPLLRSLPSSIYGESFHNPIVISSISSSTIKEPIVERQAPKDTLEAALNAYIPDTLIQHPAFIKLKLTNGISVFLEQDSNKYFDDYWTEWKRNGAHLIARAKDLFVSTFTSETFEYQPSIVVKLSAEDIRAIYRALPNQKPMIVIRY